MGSRGKGKASLPLRLFSLLLSAILVASSLPTEALAEGLSEPEVETVEETATDESDDVAVDEADSADADDSLGSEELPVEVYLVYGSEMQRYLKNGWVVDKGAGFWSVKKGYANSQGICRQYNAKLKRGKHHYTPSKNEYDTNNRKHGWRAEGVQFYVVKR